jgi:hypothetical protein
LNLIAQFVVGEVLAGGNLPSYEWIPAAWKVNPARGYEISRRERDTNKGPAMLSVACKTYDGIGGAVDPPTLFESTGLIGLKVQPVCQSGTYYSVTAWRLIAWNLLDRAKA